MNTLAAHRPMGTDTPRASARRIEAAQSRATSVSAGGNWIERLAAWAERQPVHHRMGHWQRLR